MDSDNSFVLIKIHSLLVSNPPPSPVAPTTGEDDLDEDGQVADEDPNNNNGESGPTNDHMDFN